MVQGNIYRVEMSNPITVDPLSCITVRIECYIREEQLSTASGFLYTVADKTYLITTWHVVTGRHPDTGRCLSKTAATPDRIKIYVKDANFKTYEVFIQLYEDKDCLTSLWLEHPIYKQKIDVIAINITSYLTEETSNFLHINELQQESIRLDVGKDLFIVGYPKGMQYGPSLPIWKRGTFASEPNFNIDSLPKILIDSATKEGMSGSPVIMKIWGGFDTEFGGYILNSGGPFYKFIGIYSGRYWTHNDFEAQIGFVWKKLLIEEIINAL
jgi:hypothetical protein